MLYMELKIIDDINNISDHIFENYNHIFENYTIESRINKMVIYKKCIKCNHLIANDSYAKFWYNSALSKYPHCTDIPLCSEVIMNEVLG